MDRRIHQNTGTHFNEKILGRGTKPKSWIHGCFWEQELQRLAGEYTKICIWRPKN